MLHKIDDIRYAINTGSNITYHTKIIVVDFLVLLH